MHETLDQILEAPTQEGELSRFAEVATELEDDVQAALDILEEGRIDATAMLALPVKYRWRLLTTNMVERFIEDIRPREKVIRIVPNIDSVCRIGGAILRGNA